MVNIKITELSEKTSTTYKVVDLVKDKFNAIFTNYNSALIHCKQCWKDGATDLRIVTNEITQTVEEVTFTEDNVNE